jgi:hypothetical protein
LLFRLNFKERQYMKHFLITILLFPCLAIAGPSNIPLGPNLTYGDISINNNLLSNVTNPAFGATMIKQGDNDYRIGIINVGGFYEVGDVSNIVDIADQTSTDLEQTIDTGSFTVSDAGGVYSVTNTGNTVSIDTGAIIASSISSMLLADPDIVLDQTKYTNELTRLITSETENQLNRAVNDLAKSLVDSITTSITPVITELNNDGYLKGGAAGYLPLTPFVVSHEALGGSMEIHANYSVQGKAKFLSSYVKPAAQANIVLPSPAAGSDITVASNWGVGSVSPSFDVDTDAAAIFKIATIQEIGIGYSREVYSHENGKIYAGGQLNRYDVGLSKSYVGLQNSSNVDRLLKDQLDASRETESGFGVDVGVIWVADNYRLGATINDINAPSFKYTNSTDDCSVFNDYVDINESNNNVTSATLADCNKNDSYVIDPQLKLRAVTSAWNEKLTIGLGYDANAVKDPFGQKYQWLTLGAGVNLGNWAAIRTGYRANQATNGLKFITFGFTILSFNVDLGVSSEKAQIDGESVPRSMYASLSWGLNF